MIRERKKEEEEEEEEKKKFGALRVLAQILSLRVKIPKGKCSNPILQNF